MCKPMGNFAENLNLGKHVPPPCKLDPKSLGVTRRKWDPITLTAEPNKSSLICVISK